MPCLPLHTNTSGADPFPLGHPPDQQLGLMDIQVVHHQAPFGRLSITGNQALNVSQCILLGACWSPGRREHLVRNHIE